MIEEREGDIFIQDDITCIVHQCNLYHTMGAGIARVIAAKFPLAAEADKNTPADDSKLGSFTYSSNYKDGNPFLIFNLYSQVGIGSDDEVFNRNTQYDYMVDGLTRIKHWMNDRNIKVSLGIPYGMGSDLAGGSWTIVRAIIESVFNDAEFDVVICRLPGSKELI